MLYLGESVVLLLILSCSILVDGRISPEVVALKRVLYDELQALERSALVTHSAHATSDGSVSGELRSVFHEFERQNQESIAAILRVLALVDHTLENTIEDCAKIFDLPSLESENIVFRDVTRPLLLRVAELCRQITEEDLSGLEATMEAVEKEANVYRERLDATKGYMETVLMNLENFYKDNSIISSFDETLQRMNVRTTSIEDTIRGALQNFSDRQSLMRSSLIVTIFQTSTDPDDAELITNFLDGLANETNFLADDLIELAQIRNNLTEDILHDIRVGVYDILFSLIDSPMSAFLEEENSLRCLAEYYEHNPVQHMVMSLKNMFVCYHVDDALAESLETIQRLLELTANEVETICEGLQTCFRNSATQQDTNEDIMSCFEAVGNNADSILNATAEFIEAKMDEMSSHLEDAINFEQVKMQACLFYKFQEFMISEEFIKLRYTSCNDAEPSKIQDTLEKSDIAV
ncbi:uncharacterized protein LOC131284650 [Anopheles ziemanni]|uniref:uncharacterized protein LOC131260036 n=1 Tax=Anopheles coustani TaxID=139045 RepID=UPI00265913E3|nr:uncharacterized protein LOC131260036 [Anopheles coustani]XP_058169497.1 uncharacterized protein LOC131284650 [Anopheles ziemanni]